jgi:polar amino acid transport system substrate-binding protein
VLAFFVPADSDVKFDGDIGKLGRLGIGNIRGTSYGVKLDSALKNGAWSKVVETNNIDSLVGMLSLKTIDLAIGYRHVVLEAGRKNGHLDGIRELSPSIDEVQSFFGIHQATRLFRSDKFDRALTSMKDDHSFAAIYEKYLGPAKSGR